MREIDEMACRELVEVVTDYLDGRLPAADRARFEAHLEECPGCVIAVEQFRATITGLGGLRDPEVPPDVREGLLAAFRGWSPGSPRD